MHINSTYKFVLCDNGDNLALSKKKPSVFLLKTDKVQKYMQLGKS